MLVGVFTMVGIYIIVWWTVLFAVLPLGMAGETKDPPTDGTQWGAPRTPNLKKKFLTTTWVSAVVWVFVMVLIFTGWLPLPDFSSAPAV
ncbi:DUF1467 family protein [Brevundimonas sp. SORGH_AS_0993]|uniref:DUF1467 family protein n=1 Tax=Brevundimonas sp. SORGH_AS_0993 TaxID=3041794 RepID=UPI002786664A|nr:DUF1467 family protein [Brevundimonas sp. SORGH_AS_0993]MDQ1153313.1 putative secreted protein [Brevundimonas sp. SORGH_AS_0993]